MEYFKSKWKSLTEKSDRKDNAIAVLQDRVLDRLLYDFGLDVNALFLSGDYWAFIEEALVLALKTHRSLGPADDPNKSCYSVQMSRLKNISSLIKERKLVPAALELKYTLEVMLACSECSQILSDYAPLQGDNSDISIIEKLQLFGNKLSLISFTSDQSSQPARHPAWLFKLKDLPSFEKTAERAHADWLELKKELRPYTDSFKRNAANRDRMIYSPDHEPRTDDVSYDHSLVCRIPYYDASRISVNGSSYIAAHAPEVRNAHTFYKMILANKVRIIVNLTEPYEKFNRGVCYWPKSTRKPMTFDDVGLKVELVQEIHRIYPENRCGETISEIEYVTERTFLLSDKTMDIVKYKVTMLHMRNWEDYYIPNRKVFLGLLSTIDFFLDAYAEGPTPIVVHCHAGVGRTGTTILTHSILTKLKSLAPEVLADKEVNILDSLLTIRMQREAIQSVFQLSYVISALRTYVYEKLALPNDDPIIRNEKFTREENHYRLAAYIEAMGALNARKQQFIDKHGEIKDNLMFEKFLQKNARFIGSVLFRDFTDDQVMEWTSRLAKTCEPIHTFLMKMVENNISLNELKAIVRQSKAENVHNEDLRNAYQILLAGEIHILEHYLQTTVLNNANQKPQDIATSALDSPS